MCVGTGADVMLTLPNAEVAAQAEAQLRSTLAMATMQFQRVAKETVVGRLHAGGDQSLHCRTGRDPHKGDFGWSAWPPLAIRSRELPALSGYGLDVALGLPAEGFRGRSEGSVMRMG